MRFYRDSGFAAVGSRPPQKDAAPEWLAWHFTTWTNLERIAADACLKPDSEAAPAQGVGDVGIKAVRLRTSVTPLDRPGYPQGVCVGDHVPFYFTPRSPMPYRVLKHKAQYQGDHTGLVMLGISLRSVLEQRLTWCVSDRNAASPVVRFTCDVQGLGTFIDFDLMTQFMYGRTQDDADRPTRRAAELLVLGQVPLALVTHVVVTTRDGLITARQRLHTVGCSRQYEIQPSFLYQ
ncbi:MAG TPA: DUF4433 domain-containing protein [Pseudonocardiaceae bacterium]|jgi:hypothetical protein